METQHYFFPEDNLSQSVLVVDDEPMARTLLRLMLVRAGFEVSEAEDGYDALEKIAEELPDLVILDVMMPGMDGFTVCRAVRESDRTARLPVIMLSAKTDLESVNRGLRAGANKYLTKPISPDELTRQVRSVLGEAESS
jgi:DNA-binding response OmpR family regulator